MGWVLAYNKEQSNSMLEKIEAYKDGIDEYKEAVGIKAGEGGDGSGDGSGDGGESGSGGDGDSGSGSGEGMITIDPFVDLEEVNFRGYNACCFFTNSDGAKIYAYANYIVINSTRTDMLRSAPHHQYRIFANGNEMWWGSGSTTDLVLNSIPPNAEFYGDIRNEDGTPYQTK